MEENSTNLHWNKKTILAMLGFFLLLISIPIGTYLVRQSQILNSQAAGPKSQQNQPGSTINSVKSYLNIPAFKQDLQNEKITVTPTVMISQTPQVANKINQTSNQISSVTATPAPVVGSATPTSPVRQIPTPTTADQQNATALVSACVEITCDINSDGRFDANDGLFLKSCEGKTAPFGSCQKVDVSDCEGAITAADIQIFTNQCPRIFE